MIINVSQLESLLTEICSYYEMTAPTVSEWADDLYRRLSQPDEITLSEIYYAESLCRDGWEQPNVAANRHYKLMHRLKRDTTGMAGF